MPLYEGVGLIADRQAVIIDLGTAYTKCGFATEHNPRFIFPSEIYDYKSDTSTKVVDFNRPLVEQYDVLVSFFFQIYYKKLLVNPKERRIVLLESVLSPTNYRNLLAKVLFEHFEVPSVVFLPCHLAACFPLGTQSALVVDIGYVETLVLPIYEGIPMLNCWQASPIGQRKIFENLTNLLKKYGKVNTTAGTMNLSQYPELLKESILEDIKVRTCFVTRMDRAKKIALLDQLETNILDKIDKPPPDVDYPLEGDKTLTISGFLREAACEVLFKRDVDEKSISQLILDAVLKCPIDLRRYFLERIHVIGGTCMTLGFYDRLKADLFDLLSDERDSYAQKLKAADSIKFFKSPVKENCAAWLGGAIFGGLEILPHRSVSRDDFKTKPTVPDWTSGNVTNNNNEPNGLQHQR